MSNQQGQKQYDDVTTQLAQISFTANNLFYMSLINRVPNNPNDRKERHFAFLGFAPGRGEGASRTYDMNSKIVQKIALRDMEMIAFSLEQSALGNFNVLPYKGYTNSGSGAKCLFIQKYEKGDGIVFGITLNKNSIAIVVNYAQAHAISDMIHRLYEKGLDLEIRYQMNEGNRQHSQGGAPMPNYSSVQDDQLWQDGMQNEPPSAIPDFE